MPNIQENITRIQGAKSSLKTSIQNKGVTIPDDALIDTYYTYVDQIQTGSSSGGSSDYDATIEDRHFTVNNNNGWPNSMTSTTIADGITSIPNSAFMYSKIIEIEIPDSVTSLGNYCFNECDSLSGIVIPDKVTSLGNNCFNNCNSLTSITIPDSVTSLGSMSFYFCKSLSSITIGTGVTSIKSFCFNFCRSLTAITCLPTVPPTSGSAMFDDTNNCPIYVPNDSVDAYKSAWTKYADRIFPINPEPTPTGSTENADIDVVYDVTSSTNPTKLFTSGQSIDYYTIDDDSTHHEPTSTEYTFDTTGDHTVHYYLTGDTVGEHCFQGYIPLSSVVIGTGVTSLGSYCFLWCSGLTQIICLPTTPPSEGSGMFSDTNKCPIYVPDDSVDAYKSAWYIYADRIQPLSSKPE